MKMPDIKEFEAKRDVAFHMVSISVRRRDSCPHCLCGAGLRKTADGYSLECCWCEYKIDTSDKEMSDSPL